jgi:hypothetical protein
VLDGATSDPLMQPVEEQRLAHPSPKKRGRCLTPADWAEIEELYELGRATAAELSEKYDVTPSALSKHFKKNSIIKGSRVEVVKKAVEEATITKTAAEIAKFEEKRIERIEQSKEQSYGDAILLRNLALKKVQESLKPGGAPLDIKDLEKVQHLLDHVRRARYEILEIGHDDDGGELPILPIEPMNDGDIKQKRDEQEDT